MTQKGEHTWDLVVDYHRCPKCGFINESRVEYQRGKDSLTKDITCGRCGEKFTVSKKITKKFGPIFGNATPPEFTWD